MVENVGQRNQAKMVFTEIAKNKNKKFLKLQLIQLSKQKTVDPIRMPRKKLSRSSITLSIYFYMFSCVREGRIGCEKGVNET